jgi:hypothetical protein
LIKPRQCDALAHSLSLGWPIDYQRKTGYWNLCGNSPINYSLWESAPGYGDPIAQTGSFSITAVPEPSSWVLMSLGLAALGYAARGRAVKPLIAVVD